MNKKRILIVCGLTLCLIIGAIMFWAGEPAKSPDDAVIDFDSCARAGNPIQESYPPRCTMPDGRSFTGPGG